MTQVAKLDRNTIHCLLLLWLPPILFLGPVIYNGHTFAYRDSGRFYHRQFEWNKTQWQKGNIPLWNDKENLGIPVVSEASSSVFYPLQSIFLIPGFEFSFAFVLYAAIHVYLAGVGAFFLARKLGCKHFASLFCGISYSLSGNFIFQTCNIVFLVGGSWLPFCVWASYQLSRKPKLTGTIRLAIFLALPILGGDPQTAYHVGIIAAMLMLVQWRKSSSKIARQRIVRAGGCHLAAALIAFGLAAIQILPAWNSARNSTRSYFTNARSVWELAHKSQDSDSTATEGIFGHPQPGTHHDHLYQFSQAPWTLVELVWPNVTGTVGSEHNRWSESIPAASRTWTPSIYCGLLPFVFFLAGFFKRQRQSRQRWLARCFVIFLIGSFGWFGVGWICHEFSFLLMGSEPGNSKFGAPVGGVYWFFVVLLPGYVNFRYPAKLFLVASLFLCLIAARELQSQANQQNWRRTIICLKAIFCMTIALVVTLWLSSIPISSWFDKLSFQVASEFGPFDRASAWSNMIWALMHTTLVSVVALTIFNQSPSRKILFALLGIILVADLSMSNRRLIVTARSSLWNRTRLLEKTVHDENPTSLSRVFRTEPMVWGNKNEWMSNSATNRVEQIVDFEVQTLMPKHHLTSRGSIGVVESFRTIEDERFAALMAFLKSGERITTGDSYDVTLAPSPVALGALSIEWMLTPKWGRPNIPDETIAVDLPRYEALLVRNPYALPRFSIARDVTRVKPIDRLVSWIRDKKNRDFIANQTIFGSKQRTHVIEDSNKNNQGQVARDQNELQSQSPTDSSESTKENSQIQVVRETETMIDLKIQNARGWLIIADSYDPDWHAYRIDEDGTETEMEVKRANFVMRGIAIDRENVRIRLVYRPTSVIVGAVVSVIFLLGTILSLLIVRTRQ